MEYKLSVFNINLKSENYEGIESDTLYYNVISGKFAEIPADVNMDNPPQKLITDGFVVPEDVDETENYANAQKKAIADEYPSNTRITVCPTMACNYQCEYCFEHHKSNHSMDAELIADTINYIKTEIDRNPNLKSFGIKWFGGEPLMNIKAIEQISEFVIDYCKQRNIKYSAIIITNGYFYTREVSERLKALKVQSVQIAIDGFADDYAKVRQVSKDAYSRVLQNIESSVIPVIVRINVNRQNKDIIPELVRELSKLPSVQSGFNRIMVARVKEYCKSLTYGFTDEEWLDFRKCYKEIQDVLPTILEPSTLFPCGHIQKRNIIISADGLLYRCDNHIGNNNYVIGSLKEGIRVNNIDNAYVCSTITEDCKSCKYLPICAGGRCRYEELYQGKNCLLILERFRQNMQNYIRYAGISKEKSPNKHGSMLPLK